MNDATQPHIQAFSGRPVESIDVPTVTAGGLTTDDIRISKSGLEHQAEVARRNGDVQLADNLLRAAELTAFAEEELLSYYELLRPGRATPAELQEVSRLLAARGAPRVAAMFAEAGAAYAKRQAVREGS